MIVGLDISTSIVGVCILDNIGTFVETSYVDLRKEKDFVQMCEMFNESVDFDWNPHYDTFKKSCDHLFIEDKLSGFSGGRTSQQTMMKLAAFNGAITYTAFESYHCNPIHIHPSTVKATMKRDGLFIPKGGDKKRITLDFVRRVVPDFPYEETRNGNPQPYCFDMVDAYCVARAGYLKHVCDVSGS